MFGLCLFTRKGVDYVAIFDASSVNPETVRYQINEAANQEGTMHFADEITVVTWTAFNAVLSQIRAKKLLPFSTRFTELP